MPPVPPSCQLPGMTCDDFREWRVSRGLSIHDFADQLGITSRYAYYLQSGDRAPWYLPALLHWIDCQNATAEVAA